MRPNESGEHLSPQASDESSLAIAVAYWPERWPYAVVVAALALEPHVRDMTPKTWVLFLDRLADSVRGALVDLTPFAEHEGAHPESGQHPIPS